MQEKKTVPAFTAVDEGTWQRAAWWEKHLSELWKQLKAQSQTWKLSMWWHKVPVDTELSSLQSGEPCCHHLTPAPSSGCNLGN